MFQYFPGNYPWSAAFNLALMAGGTLGELDRHLSGLRDQEPDAAAWGAAWEAMAVQQEELAERDIAAGRAMSAAARLRRACVYHQSGERQVPPGDEKLASYRRSLDAFGRAIELGDLPLERFEAPSPDGVLPGYIVHVRDRRGDGPPPVVIFYGGFDVTKELLYCFVERAFSDRGIACVVADTPGIGEPLRLRGIPSRPDYEVPTAAIIDHLERRTTWTPRDWGSWASAWAGTTHRGQPCSRTGSLPSARGVRSGIGARRGRSGGRRGRRT